MAQVKNYCSIPVDLILKIKGDIPFSVFLKLSEEKYVKVGQKADEFQSEVKKYAEKGMKFVYADKSEFADYVKKLREEKIEEDSNQDNLENLENYYKLARISLLQLGMSDIIIDATQKITDQSFKLLKTYSKLSAFFQQFRKNSKSVFMQNLIVTYVCTSVIDQFEWTTLAIKEKVNMSIMLRDILLEPEDFEELSYYTEHKEELSETLFNHPKKTAEMLEELRSKHIPSETILMVAQHHEELDGSGFPLGLRHTKINQLSAILIVVDRYVQMMAKIDFDRSKEDSVISMLEAQYNKGTFQKAVEGLKSFVVKNKHNQT